MAADVRGVVRIPYGHGRLELALGEKDAARVIEGDIASVEPPAPAD